MCEDIDEMNFHNMSTHKKYTEENTIKEGVTVVLSITISVLIHPIGRLENFWNWVSTDKKQIKDYSAGSCKMIGHLVKEVLIDK